MSQIGGLGKQLPGMGVKRSMDGGSNPFSPVCFDTWRRFGAG